MRQIKQYKVEDEPIGRGGMGQVLRGYAPSGMPVAIKEILPQYVSDIQYRDRIEKEIKFLMQFDHDNIVRVYDHFELDGRLYIVMELIEGDNIEEYVAKYGPMPWSDALMYMKRLLDTMAYVHSKQVIHRDIKPGNIMLRPSKKEPEKLDICLLDFGVAKDASTIATNSGGTMLGSIIGTDGYMSPEQAAGNTIDKRSDIYALGCVLYFMITGRHAYEKLDSDFETQYAILTKPFPRISDKRKGVPEFVQDLLDKATDRRMNMRFQSCVEFKECIKGGTIIEERQVSVTIGRENCDIIMNPENIRISRRHATVTRKQFTGGIYYVYTDESSNGTLIDNMVYTKGMSYNIKKGENPVILPAGDPSSQLDIRAITNLLDRMAEEAQQRELGQGPVTPPPGAEGGKNYVGNNGNYSPAPTPAGNGKYTNAESLFGAVKNCFKRYADFSGRSGRGEYWWWQLFNIIVNTIVIAIFIATDFTAEVLYISDVWGLVVFLPTLAVSIRRLHDTGRGWLQYILCSIFGFLLIPLILLLVWFCQAGEPMNNKYGPGSGQLPKGMRY